MRFLHTSDWQLGMTRHYLSAEDQARFSQARLDVISTLAKVASEQDCAFVVVAGDVFETNQPDRATLVRALEQLKQFAVPVYLLPGNHDPLDAASIYDNDAFKSRCPANVEVLTDEMPRQPAPGVEVVGAPWRSKEPVTDLVGQVCADAPADGVHRVVVGHGTVPEVAGSFAAPGQIDLAVAQAAISDGRVSFVALGDRHSRTQLADNVWYSGAPEPTSYREDDAGKALVVELPHSPGKTCTVAAVSVGTWHFHEVNQPVDSDHDLDTLEARLDDIADPERAIVKVKLSGTLNLAQVARLEQLLADREALFGALEQPVRHRDIAVVAAAKDLESLELTGYAAAARDRLQELSEGDDAAAQAATDALGLLLRLAGGGTRTPDKARARLSDDALGGNKSGRSEAGRSAA